MKKMNRKELIIHLRNLGNGDVLPRSRRSGLCVELNGLISLQLMNEVHRAWMTWPKWSGSAGFPVPHPKYPKDPGRANDRYYRDGHKFGSIWTGKYGDLRRKMCLHIADVLEKKKG
jgi:hypothetical protein